MDDLANTIREGDCLAELAALPEASVDLAFADPPFNIGYDYDVYDDRLECEQYVGWSRDWISAVHRVLKPNGTFWLAIGDEYAAELKVESQRLGFHSRSWVIWYYTFGVNCSRKFSRSHAHLFHFVKDPNDFTFNDGLPGPDGKLDFVRVPSARQLVYNDKRANSKGRLPDDTWILRPADVVGELMDDQGSWSPTGLNAPADQEQTFALRPQDLDRCFNAEEDTWYFPRVAGTFKERAGFHGCQMPEQLLARIIRMCSHEGDLVLDPFSGSATTLAVAKKLGRRYLGFDLSKDYVQHGLARLASIRVGDPPDGSPEPLVSAPKSGQPRYAKKGAAAKRADNAKSDKAKAVQEKEQRYSEIQLELTLRGVIEAFRLARDGCSADRVVTDPELNEEFVQACRKLGLAGDARTWNILLFRLRKAGKLADMATTQLTSVSWQDCDEYLYASEIALQTMLDADQAESLDEILCDPRLARQFDALAAQYAPGFAPRQYRWAALKLRKQAKTARTRGAVLAAPSRLGKKVPVVELPQHDIPAAPGVYVLTSQGSDHVYVGEALDLKRRFKEQFGKQQRKLWTETWESLAFQIHLTETTPAEMLAWQSCLVKKYKPRLNYRELRTAT